MKLRRFRAPTTAEALRQVKAALGAEAVILETRPEEGGGIVVTAAIDTEPRRAPLPAGPPPLAAEVRELVALVRSLVGDECRRRVHARDPGLAELYERLVADGLDALVAAELVHDALARLDNGSELGDALAAALAGAIPLAPGAGPEKGVHLFFGPPGDGKTTTVAKLAAAAQRAGRPVALLSADTYRIGGAAELETYGRLLGIPVSRVADPAELAAAVGRAAGEGALVLVDTAGVAPRDERAMEELAALTEAAGDAGRTLVLAATAAPHATARALAAFSRLAPDCCVVTKVDADPGPGILAGLWRGGLAVSHIGTGRRVPGDLEPAAAQRLVHWLVPARGGSLELCA